MRVLASEVPETSALISSLAAAYFYDCYSIELPLDQRSPLEIYLEVVAQTPPWVELLMRLRNRSVTWLGLKDLGALSAISSTKGAADYRAGDKAGIFRLIESSEHEAILGQNDKHLDVKVSVLKQKHECGMTISVSTVVQVHNLLGRVYMLFVTPAHRVIVPVTVSKLLPA